MFTVYVLRSQNNGRLYIGFTERSVQERLHEHNNGRTISNTMSRPYELLYTEVFETAELAGKRERFLKSGKGRRILKHLLSTSSVSS